MSSSKNNKKITLITLSLNSAKTIKDALASVANQDYQNIEHIIIDGYSSDSTQSIVMEYSKNSTHEVRFYEHTPRGIYNALNFGIELATGEIIGVIHADDYFSSKHSISSVMSAFEDTALCVFGNIDHITNNKKIVRRWQDTCKIEERGYWWTPPHNASYIHKDLYITYGTYDESYYISGDYDFFCRLPRDIIRNFRHLDKTVMFQITGGVSTSFRNIIQKELEDFRVLRKYSVHPVRDYVNKKIFKFHQLNYSFLKNEK